MTHFVRWTTDGRCLVAIAAGVLPEADGDQERQHQGAPRGAQAARRPGGDFLPKRCLYTIAWCMPSAGGAAAALLRHWTPGSRTAASAQRTAHRPVPARWRAALWRAPLHTFLISNTRLPSNQAFRPVDQFCCRRSWGGRQRVEACHHDCFSEGSCTLMRSPLLPQKSEGNSEWERAIRVASLE